MNENSQQLSFYLVLPSTSSHEIFLENHAGKFTSILPKQIQFGQKFHWEMALVELFWPKQDSVAVIENLWFEKQEMNRRWKRTYVPSFAKISKVWEKRARADPNHPQHYIEIAFTPGQSLVNNEKPEDQSFSCTV